MKKYLLPVISSLVLISASWSQSFSGTYTFGSAGNTNSFSYNGAPIPNLTVGSLAKIGVTSGSSTGNFRASNWALDASVGTLTGSVDLGKYFDFTLTAAAGYTFDMSSLNFGVGRSGTGTRSFQWRSSLDSFGSVVSGYTSVNAALNQNLGAGILSYTTDVTTSATGNVLSFSGSSFTNLSSVTFRFYGFNSEASGGTGGLDGPFTFAGTLNAPVGTTYVWSGGNGSWANGVQGNFDAVYADSGIAVAQFGTTGGTVTVAGSGVETGQIQFAASGYELTGGTVTNALGSISVASGTATISSDVAGTAGLTKTGVGTLVLEGAKTFTGNVTVSDGTLQISTDDALGDAANDLVLGGTLRTTNSLALGAGRNLSGVGTLDIADGTTLTVNGATAMSGTTLANTGTLAFANVASDPGNITTTYSSGTAVISGNVNFGASDKIVNVASGGTLQMSGAVNLPTASGTELTKEGEGVLYLSGTGSSISRLQLGRAGTTPTAGGILRVSDGASLGAQEMYFNGATIEPTADLTMTPGMSISGRAATPSVIGGAGGSGALTVNGAVRFFGPTGTTGDIVLNVNNQTTFAGGMGNFSAGSTISGLTVGGAGRLTIAGGSSATTVSAPVTLTDTVDLVVGTGTTAFGGGFNLSNADNSLSLASDSNASFAGVISGAGSLVKSGVGTATLSGANSYAGTTTVTGGALIINGDQSAAGGILSVASGAAIGGTGTLGGSLFLDAGANFVFDLNQPLLTATGTTVSFGGFGISNVLGLGSDTAVGTYTLIGGNATFNLANVSNFGAANAYDLGGGKSAYFSAGSLELNVVPEPSTYALLALAAAGLAGHGIRRRRR